MGLSSVHPFSFTGRIVMVLEGVMVGAKSKSLPEFYALRVMGENQLFHRWCRPLIVDVPVAKVFDRAGIEENQDGMNYGADI